MDNTQKKIDIVNQAIEINNDRIAGYEKASEIVSGDDIHELQNLFDQYRHQSEQFNTELRPFVEQFGAEADEGTRMSGKLFRIWMDIKSIVAPSTSQAVLENCEKGEDEWKEAYRKLLNDSVEHYPELTNVLQDQMATQISAHDHIKSLRDR